MSSIDLHQSTDKDVSEDIELSNISSDVLELQTDMKSNYFATKQVKVSAKFQSILTQSDSSGNQIVTAGNDAISQSDDSQNNRFVLFIRSFLCYCFQNQTKTGQSITINKNDKSRRLKAKSSSSSNLIQSNSSNEIKSTSRFAFFSQTVQLKARPMPVTVPHFGEVLPRHKGKKLLVLDLDETLVHSSFQPVNHSSFMISVCIDHERYNIFVIKRPGVDEFIRRVSEHYELIVYTASLSKYADPLLDVIDKDKLISRRLFRENCVFYNGHYVKDLSLISNRDLSQIIIVDNSPMSYLFHPENAIDCSSFIDNQTDVEMWYIADFLISISKCDDVRQHCRLWRKWCQEHPSTAVLATLL